MFHRLTIRKRVAVGTPVAQRPPRRSVRERLTHTAPALDSGDRAGSTNASASHACRLGVAVSPPLCADGARLTRVLRGPSPSLQALRRGLPAFVRALRRYYGSVRLLRDVHVGRAAIAFTHRPAAASRASRRSPGSRAGSFRTCPGSSTAPESTATRVNAAVAVAFPYRSLGRPPERGYFTAP
jgi:hypothetical protein